MTDTLPGLQAWVLRRMITVFNGICGRPHRPREQAIRDMLERLGVKLPDKPSKHKPGDSSEDDSMSELENAHEENAEEEDPTGDEVCLRLNTAFICKRLMKYVLHELR